MSRPLGDRPGNVLDHGCVRIDHRGDASISPGIEISGAAMQTLGTLPAIAGDGTVHVVIETPKGSRNKYAFDETLGAFVLRGVLPEGTSFPYDFGFVPSSKGGDGDPLDVLVIMEAPAFPGCVITVRMIGAIEAEQTERDGTRERNDRLIGIATQARTHEHVRSLSDLRPHMIEEIEAFFEHYNRLAGKTFEVAARSGADAAMQLVRTSLRDAG